MGSTNMCVQKLLAILNFIIILNGAALFVLGVIYVCKSLTFFVVTEFNYVMIGGGILYVIGGSIGCVGAVRVSKPLTITNALMLLLLLICKVAIFILFLIAKFDFKLREEDPYFINKLRYDEYYCTHTEEINENIAGHCAAFHRILYGITTVAAVQFFTICLAAVFACSIKPHAQFYDYD